MKKIFNKERVVFGILLITLIAITEVIIHYMRIPGWPMFTVMVFFFLGHTKRESIKNILIGGVFGIICCVLLHRFNIVVEPVLGDFIGKVIFICIFVFSIVLFKDTLPIIFNDYAFMFFLISSLATAYENPILIISIELLGGFYLVMGVLLIKKTLSSMERKATI